MFGLQKYQEGQFSPKPGAEHNWHVWCNTGALEVLRGGEYAQWLVDHPGEGYTINFGNGSAAKISPGHPLWQCLAEITKTHMVEVFRLTSRGEYVSWDGDNTGLRVFDAIKIRPRTPTPS